MHQIPYQRPQRTMTGAIATSLLITIAGCGSESTTDPPARQADTGVLISKQVVEASCGQCQFGVGERGCDLAVRIDGNAYFVDGSGIDDHGDAHAADGVCNVIRRALVTGTVVDDRFQSTSFAMLPLDE